MNLKKRYCRWRHRRGFGIHSPFAYRLIREALYPSRGYAYYHEMAPALQMTAPLLPCNPPLIFRLLIFMLQNLYDADNGVAIFSPQSLSPFFRILTDSGNFHRGGSPMNSDIFIITDDITPSSSIYLPLMNTVKSAIRSSWIISNSHSNLINALTARMEELNRGLILSSRDFTIMIIRPEMHLTCYDI